MTQHEITQSDNLLGSQFISGLGIQLQDVQESSPRMATLAAGDGSNALEGCTSVIPDRKKGVWVNKQKHVVAVVRSKAIGPEIPGKKMFILKKRKKMRTSNERIFLGKKSAVSEESMEEFFNTENEAAKEKSMEDLNKEDAWQN
ncbi:Uncharacterized protein Fot_31976 [Forsythia ovata]|uniref:Uncharacterized protein n=1 Tax=Forsythia ovata TaxID=205694 RepID=A0ABD1T6J8_9LAMI